ncbi:hypothetical protein ACFOLC_05525 [Lysobacter cavernae]|uniref:Lipoprotein n=1 Tax=Lysobacter cavernae TaxID=1685901 RepID=A0ABV7RPC0_9GAMM
MKLIAALGLVTVLVACATVPVADPCAHDKAALLALDESAFDQDLSNGGGGWRKIGNVPGCEPAAADLISAYRVQHPSASSTLAWHEGQMLASAGQNTRAIPLLEGARKDPSQDHAGWNHYVDATVAFLRNDKAGLLQARDHLAAVPYPTDAGMPALRDGYIELPTQPGQPSIKMRWPPNIEVVDGFVACFGRAYNEAYGASCRPAAP